MQRSSYALLILLQSIGLSLVLVGSARSQSGVLLLDSVSGAALSAKLLATSPTLDDIYSAYVCDYELTAAKFADDNASAEANAEEQPATVAVKNYIHHPVLTGTGYDSSYDFAMFDGSYQDAQSNDDLEADFSDLSHADCFEVEVFTATGPATSLYFDDYDCCLEGYQFTPWKNGCRTADRVHVSREVVEDGEADSWVEASASSVAAETMKYLQVAGRRTWDVVQVSLEGAWLAASSNRLFADDAIELTAEEIFDDEEVTYFTHASAKLEYAEELMMIRAATALDHLSLRLQEAAQQLRYMAAEKIVTKTQSRRLAQRDN